MDKEIFSNRTMNYLLAINSYRNITKAAESLYISQPALSKFLNTLEKRLGFSLFNNIGHTLIPTYEGERFLHYAQLTEQLEQQLTHEITDWQNQQSGRLRFALPLMRSPYILPQVIPNFLKMYPHVQVSVFEEHSDKLKSLIMENKVDFLLSMSEEEIPNTVRCHIRTDRLYLAAPAGQQRFKASTHKQPYPSIDLSLLKEEAFILQQPGQHTRLTAEKAFAAAGYTPKILLITRSIQAALELVAQGCGLCFFIETYMNYTKNLPLQIYSISNQYPATEVYLLWRKGIYMPQYFRDFIEIVKTINLSGQ